jgi:hypothetical protein
MTDVKICKLQNWGSPLSHLSHLSHISLHIGYLVLGT